MWRRRRSMARGPTKRCCGSRRCSRSSRRRSGTISASWSTSSASATAARMMRQTRPRAARGRAALRRRPPRHRGGLGRGDRLRPRRRRQFPAACAGDARLPGRPPHGFWRGELIAALKLVERGDLGLERALRLVGRRLRADAVHPVDLSAARGRFRRRRPPRPRRLGRRCAWLDGELPAATAAGSRATPG